MLLPHSFQGLYNILREKFKHFSVTTQLFTALYTLKLFNLNFIFNNIFVVNKQLFKIKLHQITTMTSRWQQLIGLLVIHFYFISYSFLPSALYFEIIIHYYKI